MYSAVSRTTSRGLSSLRVASEPILEKRSATTCNRAMSLSISFNASSSTPLAASNPDHAISELNGVPNWCAVSLAMPTQTRFCSARLEAENTR